ncbi:MAG: hypothetical protein ACOC45_08185 [Alkalispirochaetaceae bacterium]
MIKRIATSILVVLLCASFLWITNRYPSGKIATPGESQGDVDPTAYILENFLEQTGAENAVAAIYLNYRVYDTLFEALLLLIAIVGIMHFFRIGSARDRNE